jgi:muramoyltetrapeptide carboxypeptidase
VIAPSGPFDRALALRAIGWLGERYRVEFDWEAFRPVGMFAGSDARRLAELNQALRTPHTRAIWAARGGHGLIRIAHLADYPALLRHPKWVVGFSDVTLLHVELSRAGVASLHAPNLTGLGRGDAVSRTRMIETLEAPRALRTHRGLLTWVGGKADGTLAGGNLAMLFTCAAAGRLFLPRGCILVLEDVTEAPYRLDRMLAALKLSGAFERVAACVVGDFTRCPVGGDGIRAEQVVQATLADLGVPVLAGLPIGHGRHNEPLPLGLPATVDGEAGTLTVGDATAP